MGNVSSSNGLGKLVPKLRFPQFRDEWETVKLSDFVDRVTRKNNKNQTNLPLTISSKDGLVDQITYFSKTVASKDMSGYYLLMNGEFAYNKSYSVGYDFGSIKRLDHYPMGALSTLYICFALKKYDSDFIKVYFDSLKWYREIYMIAAEGARNHGLLNIPTEGFFETRHTLPMGIAEQKKIATFLTLLDKRIAKQRELVESLKSYKRGVNLYLLSKFSEYTTLDKLCSIVGGGTPDTSNIEYWNGNVQWFTPSEIGKQKYVISSERTISNSGLNNSSAKLLPIDTVLLTTRATLGEMSISQCQCTTNQGFQSLIPNANAKSEYLYYLQVIIKPWCEKYASGNTFREISKKNLSKCLVPLLSDKEQEKIISILRAIDGNINRNEAVLDNLTKMKNALLKQLFI